MTNRGTDAIRSSMQTETEIKSGIPVPAPHSSQIRYPFAEMKIGDCFEKPKAQGTLLRVAASHYKKTHPGWGYTTRIVGDQVCLWCTALPKPERT